MDEPPLDIESLVREIARQAEALRAEVGASRLPEAEDRDQALAKATAGSAGRVQPGAPGLGAATNLASLAALADPGDVEFHSHRVRAGRVVIAVKRILRRLLTPILDRQAAYNRAVVQSLGGLQAEVGRQLQVLDRRLAVLEESVSALAGGTTATAAPFDYGAFEDAFRGERERVRTSLQRYLQYFPSPEAGPVVDLGCGRGEFLEILAEAGIAALGIELDAERVADCRARSLDVRQGDVLAALEAMPDRSLGGVVAFQVVEHLTLAKTVRLLAQARLKLRPGGCLIVETVNVASLITFSRAWSIDPTHRQPLHPLTLRFLVEQAGFAPAEIVFGSEVDATTRLEGEGEAGAGERNVARLNSLLFGPQDYAVVARA